MKKLIFIMIFFLFISFLIPKKDNSKMVMANINNTNYYRLIFNNENLNLGNFKLKIGLFTSYDTKIKKIYFKYNDNIKDYFKDKNYFSFDNSNFNIGIEKLKEEYNLVLKDNYLYNELDKDINTVTIKMVELYTESEAINKFKQKYPNVKILSIE